MASEAVRVIACVVVTIAAMLLAAPATAQQAKEQLWCDGKDGASPDQQVSACKCCLLNRLDVVG